MSSELRRGIALGLWILAGLAFLVSALFPLSAGAGTAGPLLLALAAGGTALTSPSSAFGYLASRRFSLPAMVVRVVVLLFVLGIALTIIRDGDRRSFWYVAGVALVALTIARGR